MNKSMIQKISRSSLRDQVYTALKQNIIRLELEPGQKLNDAELAEQFGVSRTPVREALKKLEDEGLVESFPGAVTRITPLYETSAAYAFPVAAALHGLAARLAAPKLQDVHYEQMEKANQQLIDALQQQDAHQAIAADDHFHEMIIEAAENPEIAATLAVVMPKIRRLELAKFSQIDRYHSPEDHKLIIAACRQQDAALAGEYMERNWLSLGRWLTARNDSDLSAQEKDYAFEALSDLNHSAQSSSPGKDRTSS